MSIDVLPPPTSGATSDSCSRASTSKGPFRLFGGRQVPMTCADSSRLAAPSSLKTSSSASSKPSSVSSKISSAFSNTFSISSKTSSPSSNTSSVHSSKAAMSSSSQQQQTTHFAPLPHRDHKSISNNGQIVTASYNNNNSLTPSFPQRSFHSQYSAPNSNSPSSEAAASADFRRFFSSSTLPPAAFFDAQQQQQHQNTVAMSVLVRVHKWCCQLFWLTIVCLIGVCAEQREESQKKGAASRGRAEKHFGGGAGGLLFGLEEVRKGLKLQAPQRHGSKRLQELEAQLLRHLTRPQDDMFQQSIGAKQHSHKPKIYRSCPPSPRLFRICEEEAEF